MVHVDTPIPQSQSQSLPTEVQQQLSYDRNDPAVQRAMIDAFSQQSGMKIEWAKKCLEDSQWDFDVSLLFDEILHYYLFISGSWTCFQRIAFANTAGCLHVNSNNLDK
jgi:hypothetical protein